MEQDWRIIINTLHTRRSLASASSPPKSMMVRSLDGRDLLIAWSLLPFLTPLRKRLLAESDGTVTALGRASLHQLEETLSINRAQAALVKEPLTFPGMAVALERHRQAAITLLDDDYPPLLRRITDPPLALFCEGEVEMLQRPMIAVVGSRLATPYAINAAGAIAAGLARCGIVVVSGMARGVDRAAHEAALGRSGPTLAVLGTGLDVSYPREHVRLRERIAREGLLLSELPLGTPPRKEHFPVRNRIIAGLARGVVVVAAGPRSGSLITARLASEEGREVFAVPGPIFDEGTEGGHRLIQAGAKLLHDLADIFEELPDLAPVDAPAASPVPRESALMRHLSKVEGIHLELLAQRAGVRPEALAQELLELELEGRVRALPGGRYIISTG